MNGRQTLISSVPSAFSADRFSPAMIDHAKKLRALVVEDDARMVPTIEDTLFSMGHEFELATNQHDAQQLIEGREYSYALLDLDIPARPKRRLTHKDFGVNLLAHLQQTRHRKQIPAIVMAERRADYLDVVGEVIRLGASDFITKPFPKSGRTLSKVILRALKKAESMQRAVISRPTTIRPFEGGELAIFPGRIDLCGVTICTGKRCGMIRQILKILAKETGSGSRPAYSGLELAELVSCQGGENGIAGCIRDFRVHVMKIMVEEAGLRCGTRDVIDSGGPGYRLNSWITVHGRDRAVNLQGHDDPITPLRGPINSERGPINVPVNPTCDPVNPGHGPTNGPINSLSVPVNYPVTPIHDPINRITGSENDHALSAEDSLTRRRSWILGELTRGQALRAPLIADELCCSERTVKRILNALKREGRIEFVGPNKTGYYRLQS